MFYTHASNIIFSEFLEHLDAYKSYNEPRSLSN